MNKLNFLTSSRGLFADKIYSANENQVQAGLLAFTKQATMAVFDPRTFAFIQDLSGNLLKQVECRQFPELIALGFWLREANLQIKIANGLPTQWSNYLHFPSADKKAKRKQFNDTAAMLSKNHQALGCAVHFTPANVDTMFIYSWIAALLMGNLNIVRVASQNSQSKVVLLKLINRLFTKPAYEEIVKRNVFVSYDKESSITNVLCAIADARLMWGGDASVAQIQSFSVKTSCQDFCFADRYSIAIVDANTLADSTITMAQALWRDTQPFQQHACSSPRVLYVVAESLDQIDSVDQIHQNLLALFNQVDALAYKAPDEWQSIGNVNEHLVLLQNMALSGDCVPENAVLQLNQVTAMYLSKLSAAALMMHNGNGFFYVRLCQSLEQVVEELSQSVPEKLQTIALAGIDEEQVNKAMKSRFAQSNFRVQPLGQALDFDFKWDGYELLSSLCR